MQFMNTDLFNKIAKTLKQQFPKATDEFLMQQAREMYEAEMQRRSKLSKTEQLSAEFKDRLRGK
jgi:TRAP-type C4-dicarboxylate transport system substrate-binding protein